MTEAVDARNIAEIGGREFGKLVTVLADREGQRYNSVGWDGSASELRASVEKKSLYPASAFAVVAEGISRYKRTGAEFREDTDSMRELSRVLSEGSVVYKQASEMGEKELKLQIKKYIESHGGTFDNSVNWAEFIKERSDRIKQKADKIDEVNR